MYAQQSGRARAARCGGWMLTEVVISVVLLGVLLTTMLSVETTAGRANHFQLTRQRCIAAAQATLECVSATGKPLPAADVVRLWPGLSVAVRRSPGTGDWVGLSLVTAVARGRSGREDVRVELRRYVLPAGKQGGRP